MADEPCFSCCHQPAAILNLVFAPASEQTTSAERAVEFSQKRGFGCTTKKALTPFFARNMPKVIQPRGIALLARSRSTVQHAAMFIQSPYRYRYEGDL
jgi:hypothetical protein